MSAALRYEWIRTITVRSTWVLGILAIALPAALTFFIAWATADLVASGQTTGPGGPGSEGFAPFGLSGATVLLLSSLLVTIGAAAFGQEYRHGLIRVTLSVLPHRNAVFAAKTVMVILVVAVIAIISIAAVALGNIAGLAFGGGSDATELVEGLLVQLRALIVVEYFVLMALAITALTRNQPLGILVPIVGAAVVEPLITLIASIQNWTWITWVLPFNGALESVSSSGPEAWGHLGVAALWLAAVLIPAWVLFDKRDA
jgi:ABC-2 type transport system permease protein